MSLRDIFYCSNFCTSNIKCCALSDWLKSNWIDFNAGRIVTDDLPLEDAAKELFQLVLDVASGKKVKAEIAGFHDLAIFKQGVTL